MTVKAGTAYIDLDADWSAFNRKFAQQGHVLSRRASQIGSQLGGAMTRGATIAAKAGAAGVAAGMIYAVKKAADFEQQLSTLGSVADASAKQLDRMRRQALKAGADTAFSALEAAQAQTELAKGGLSVAQIMSGGLDAALALAAAGEMNLADAAATTVNAMKQFGLSGDQAMKVADGLATAANVTTADVSDFALALVQGGAAAKAAGLDLTETTAALEALAEMGVKGSDAGTSLKAALTQLANPTKESAGLMEKLGLSFFDANGEIRPLTEIAKMLRERLGGLTRQQRLQAATTLAGTDGMRALLALYDAGGPKIEKFEKGLTKQGTAADVAKRRQDNLKGAIEEFGGSVETLAISVGTKAIPTIRELTEDLTGLTNKITPILNRTDLTLGEKLQRVFDIARVDAAPWLNRIRDAIDQADLPERLSQAVSKAAPAMANAAGQAAPKVLAAFLRAFIEADAWGRLAIGAVIVSKLGGLGAFRSAGARAGGAFAEGMATAAALPPVVRGGKTGPAPGPKSKGFTSGSPLVFNQPGVVRGSKIEGLTKGNPLGDRATQTAVGVAAGKTIGQGVGTGIVQSGLRGRLANTFRAWGPGLGIALGLTLGPELGKKIVEAGRTVTPKFNLPKKPDQGLDFLLPGTPFEDLKRKVFGINSELENFAQKSEKAFEKFQKLGDARGLSELASKARRLARDFPAASGELGRFADAAEQAARDAAGAFRDVSQVGGRKLRDIKTATAEVDFEIRNKLGPGTRVGKEALAKNFAAAAKAVKKSMDAGVISTKTGTEQIEKYMVAALQQMGFTKEQALKVRKGQDPVSGKAIGGKQNLTGKQRGGLIDIGAPSGDSVPALLERGEYVLNRKAVAKLGRATLDRLNFAQAPRFQTGGIVALGRRLQAEGYQVGEHPAFGGVGRHVPGSYHYRGMALDVNADGKPGGERAWLDRLYERLKGMPGIVELLWRVAGHFDHLHVAMAGGAGKLGDLALGMVAPRIKRVLVDGPDSPLKTLTQGAIDTSRDAAQQLVDAAAASASGGGSYASWAGSWVDLMAKIASERGWNLGDWKRLVQKESGGNPAARNPTSGAFGLGQFLGATAKAYAKYGALSSDPVDQIRAMAKYIADRYGNPTRALAFHDRHNWYRLGGLVELAAGGDPARITGSSPQRTTGAALKKPKRRSSRRNDKKRARKWRPPRYRNRIREFAAGGLFAAYGEVIDKLTQDYANTERRQALTDEEATKSIPVSQATDAELAAHGLSPEEIARLRTDPDQVIELLNPDGFTARGGQFVGGITHRVAEIDQLIGLKNTIADRLNTQQGIAATAIRQIARAIAERQKRAEAIRDKARENIRKIRALYDRIAELNKAERKAKGRKARKELAKRHAPERKRIARQLDRLRDENQRLIGTRSVDVDLRGDEAPGGLLRSTIESRKAWESERDDLLPEAKELPQKLTDITIDVEELVVERRNWLNTAPPGIDVPAPPEPDTPDKADNSELLELLKQKLTEERQRTALSEAQFSVFRGAGDLMPPFAGVFHQGGVVPGPAGAERTAIVQAGETITPRGADGPQVRVVVEDRRVRVYVDDVEQIVERKLRTDTRRAGRSLPGAGRRF